MLEVRGQPTSLLPTYTHRFVVFSLVVNCMCGLSESEVKESHNRNVNRALFWTTHEQYFFFFVLILL